MVIVRSVIVFDFNILFRVHKIDCYVLKKLNIRLELCTNIRNFSVVFEGEKSPQTTIFPDESGRKERAIFNTQTSMKISPFFTVFLVTKLRFRSVTLKQTK
jgi:hypothetical protein